MNTSLAVRSLLRAVLATVVVGCGPSALADAPAKDVRDVKKDKPDAKAEGDPLAPASLRPRGEDHHGQRHRRRQRIDYRAIAGTLVVHPKGWDDVTAARRHRARQGQAKGRGRRSRQGEDDEGRGVDVLRRLLQAGRARASRGPITFLYNGGPGSATVWLHMGAFGPRRVVTPGDQHLPAAPYTLVNNDVEPARRDRPRVHRRARRGLQPHRRPRQGEVVLRRRRRRPRLRRVHHAVPRQVRALELAQVPLRRELRHDALRGAHRRARDAPAGRLQRRHPALADPELRALPGRRRRQPRASTSRTSSRCRPTPRPPGTTTSSAPTCPRT